MFLCWMFDIKAMIGFNSTHCNVTKLIFVPNWTCGTEKDWVESTDGKKLLGWFWINVVLDLYISHCTILIVVLVVVVVVVVVVAVLLLVVSQ
jgi:hypothetical protein